MEIETGNAFVPFSFIALCWYPSGWGINYLEENCDNNYYIRCYSKCEISEIARSNSALYLHYSLMFLVMDASAVKELKRTFYSFLELKKTDNLKMDILAEWKNFCWRCQCVLMNLIYRRRISECEHVWLDLLHFWIILTVFFVF